MRRSVIAGFAVLIAAAVASGCATRDLVKKEHDSIKAGLEEAAKMGAKVCAPEEYASAEAHLDFALDEWAERDYSRAHGHLTVADAQVARAKELSKNCIEVRPPDADGDGILDDRDACPKEPEDKDGFKDEDGCPDPDNDGDGIPDAKDKCPGEAETVNGFEDEDGCPDFNKITVTEKQILLREEIHFATGKSTILVDSYPILDEVVQALKDNPKIRIRVEGHTDSTGSAEANRRLSEARAKAVVDYLTDKGIAADRMVAQGFGPDRPVAPNNTDKGRAKNRRVEIHILE